MFSKEGENQREIVHIVSRGIIVIRVLSSVVLSKEVRTEMKCRIEKLYKKAFLRMVQKKEN